MNESYDYLKQYYDAVNHHKIVSKTDISGKIIFANKNFCKISGYSESELLNKPHSIVRHPDMSSKVFHQMWDTLLSGKVWRGEVKNKRKDGTSYWTKSDIIPIFENNKIVEFISFREDITQKKLMEMKLKKETEFKKELFNSLPNVSLLIHKEKGVVLTNNQFFEEFPFSTSEEFNKKHSCICELFLEKRGFLKKSTPERHWSEEVLLSPNKNHKALIRNKEGNIQTYFVSINKFNNNDLFLVSMVNISFLEEHPIENVENASIRISKAISLIDSFFEKGVHPEFYKFFKEIENTLLGKK